MTARVHRILAGEGAKSESPMVEKGKKKKTCYCQLPSRQGSRRAKKDAESPMGEKSEKRTPSRQWVRRVKKKGTPSRRGLTSWDKIDDWGEVDDEVDKRTRRMRVIR
jgi:hypothetical protein